MALGLYIADLHLADKKVDVRSRVGVWEFEQVSNYEVLMSKTQIGQCVSTYMAFNEDIHSGGAPSDFDIACEDLRDLCLLLSFMNATCVTPSKSTEFSDPMIMALGDMFVLPRAIRGFPELKPINSNATYLTKGLVGLNSAHGRHLRLLMHHWISGLTCYTLEDVFLAISVLLDIVKQIEILISGKQLTYAQGMTNASKRLGLSQPNANIKRMRNDLVHEGFLSGSNFKNRTKLDCAFVISESLNWLDEYILASLNISNEFDGTKRWHAQGFNDNLPSFSLVI